MKVVKNISGIEYDKNSAITVGTFDGVHLGHRKIISELNKIKKERSLRSIVVTFDPHPQLVLRNKAKDIKTISTTEEKLEIFGTLNIDLVYVINFTRSFSQTSAEDFYKYYLIDKIGLSHLVLGYDHMFGKDREGDFVTLKKLSSEFGFEVDRVPEYKVDGEHISSSTIRKLLQSGNILKANKFLGREYSLKGSVVEGKKLGRELGYPTINIKVTDENKLIPKNGVYTVRVLIGGKEFFGMMSIGFNPTVSEENIVKLETNLFDFDENVYGNEIEIFFIEYHREEIKFENIEELRSQLENDKKKSLISIKEYKKINQN